MRDIRRVIEYVKAVTFQEVVVKEEILALSEDRARQIFQVSLAAYNVKGEAVERPFYEIVGDQYDKLKQNGYTDEDIWTVIDELRAEGNEGVV